MVKSALASDGPRRYSVPVGFGQHRTVTQLPVLTMVTR
jgi:hypothetical protein